jgi:hypothetical protein
MLTDPEKALPHDLVTMLPTTPFPPPYSAGIPDVNSSSSWMTSLLKLIPALCVFRLVMFIPSMK